jgi:putative transposase
MGHRRAYQAARAEGWVVNHKKVQRLWRQEGLSVPVRRRRKRTGSSTHPPVHAAECTECGVGDGFSSDMNTRFE